MRNQRFLNIGEIEKYLRTHPNKEKLIAKLDNTISYWKNKVRKSF
jgi:hypothetical protein